MKTPTITRLTIGSLHRAADVRPIALSPAETADRDSAVVRSIDKILRKPIRDARA